MRALITVVCISVVGCVRPLPASVSPTPSSLAWSARDAGARDAAIGATPDGSIAEPLQAAVTAIFAQATWEWIQRGARRCERTLTLVRLAPVQRVENTRDLWHTTVLVRDERSGAEHSFWLRGQAPSAPTTDWRLFFGDSDIASVFKLYAASEWLDAHPDVFAVTRQRPDGREGVIWSLATTQGTTVCVSMSHAHGPTLEGCWSERGPLMRVPAFAFEFRSEPRWAIVGSYTLAEGLGVVRVSIDEQGAVRRSEQSGRRAVFGPLRAVPAATPPSLGPFASIEAVLGYSGSSLYLNLRSENENLYRRCVRADRWRCGAVSTDPNGDDTDAETKVPLRASRRELLRLSRAEAALDREPRIADPAQW